MISIVFYERSYLWQKYLSIVLFLSCKKFTCYSDRLHNIVFTKDAYATSSFPCKTKLSFFVFVLPFIDLWSKLLQSKFNNHSVRIVSLYFASSAFSYVFLSLLYFFFVIFVYFSFSSYTLYWHNFLRGLKPI